MYLHWATLGHCQPNISTPEAQTQAKNSNRFALLWFLSHFARRLCNDLQQLIQERADIEKGYAKSLRTWSKKWGELIEKGKWAAGGEWWDMGMWVAVACGMRHHQSWKPSVGQHIHSRAKSPVEHQVTRSRWIPTTYLAHWLFLFSTFCTSFWALLLPLCDKWLKLLMVFFYVFRYLVFVGCILQKLRTVVQNRHTNLFKYVNERGWQSVWIN